MSDVNRGSRLLQGDAITVKSAPSLSFLLLHVLPVTAGSRLQHCDGVTRPAHHTPSADDVCTCHVKRAFGAALGTAPSRFHLSQLRPRPGGDPSNSTFHHCAACEFALAYLLPRRTADFTGHHW
jgi:hypothetical protein